MDSRSHYKNLLSPVYSWMFGDFSAMVARQKALLEVQGLDHGAGKLALDLGCGPGFQSLALSELGYHVHAVDLSEELLAELKTRCPGVRTHLQDMSDLSRFRDLKPSIIVCMGDTLSHLPSLDSVSQFLSECFGVLDSRGKLILSYRDLSHLPEGPERFIPVRSDHRRIMTCFLEDLGDKVRVTDLVYENTGSEWVLRKSAYEKVKIPVSWLQRELARTGFSNVRTETTSLNILTAEKN